MIAIIPARSGSKRVKNKNVRPLSGHPLVAYTIRACQLSRTISRIIVSTDCKQIATICESYGAEVPFLRPKELATDASSDLGFLNHFFENVECDHVALMRPTSPLRDPLVIDEAVRDYYNGETKEITGFRTVYVFESFSVQDV